MIPRSDKKLRILITVLLVSLFYYCGEDSSTDIPTDFTNVTDELASGWEAYRAGNYPAAASHFITVAERDAEIAETYNGLAWTYLRQKDFSNAASQFSFVVSLATLQGNDVIKADAYAGMFLLKYIQQVEGRLDESLTEEQAEEILITGLQYADSVLKLNSDYSTEHDPGFDVSALKKLVAYSYYSMHRFSDVIDVVGYDVQSDTTLETVTEEVHLQADADGKVFGTLPSGGAVEILEVKDKSVVVTGGDSSWTAYAPAEEAVVFDYYLKGHNRMEFPPLKDFDYPVRTDTCLSFFQSNIFGPQGYYIATSRAGVFNVTSFHLDTLDEELVWWIYDASGKVIPTTFEWNYVKMTGTGDYIISGNPFVISYSYGNYEVTYKRTDEFLELVKLLEEYL